MQSPWFDGFIYFFVVVVFFAKDVVQEQTRRVTKRFLLINK